MYQAGEQETKMKRALQDSGQLFNNNSEIHENEARDCLQCINIGQYSHKKLLLLDN